MEGGGCRRRDEEENELLPGESDDASKVQQQKKAMAVSGNPGTESVTSHLLDCLQRFKSNAALTAVKDTLEVRSFATQAAFTGQNIESKNVTNIIVIKLVSFLFIYLFYLSQSLELSGLIKQ